MPSFIFDANILYKKRLQQATDPKKVETIQKLLADAETSRTESRQGDRAKPASVCDVYALNVGHWQPLKAAVA